MQPTRLPDDLFADEEWRALDYSGRVAFLIVKFHAALIFADTLQAELRDVRERNAQLSADLEQTGEVNARLLRQLADALSRIETLKTQGADPGF